MLTTLLVRLEGEQRELERNTFEYPPADWPAFQERLGQWRGKQAVIEEITEQIEGQERKERSS